MYSQPNLTAAHKQRILSTSAIHDAAKFEKEEQHAQLHLYLNLFSTLCRIKLMHRKFVACRMQLFKDLAGCTRLADSLLALTTQFLVYHIKQYNSATLF